MNKPKFTPGPWHAETKRWKPLIVQGKTCILAETWESNQISREEANSNAALISAAPEMYAELERIEDILEDSEDCGEISLDRIKSILRKASGESEVTK